MALTSLFKIGQTDFSSHIEAGSYSVYNQPIYKELEDANCITHKRFLRNQVKGSFKIFFRTLAEYSAFYSAISTAQSPSDYSVPVTLYDVKEGVSKSINVFLEYPPKINLDGTLKEFIEPFEIKIEER